MFSKIGSFVTGQHSRKLVSLHGRQAVVTTNVVPKGRNEARTAVENHHPFTNIARILDLYSCVNKATSFAIDYHDATLK